MVVEWFFLVSILSGPIVMGGHPDAHPNELGWQNVERTKHSFSGPLGCHMAQKAMVRREGNINAILGRGEARPRSAILSDARQSGLPCGYGKEQEEGKDGPRG